MLVKLFCRFTSLLIIVCLVALLVPAQRRRGVRRNRAIGAGGAGTYVRKNTKPKGFFVNVEALPVRARKSRRGRRR
jgi:hypothetical protein